MDLPSASDNQPFFNVTPLEGGSLGMREHLFVSDPDPEKVTVVPSLCFLMRRSTSGEAILFDLGIKKDMKGYSPITQSSLKTSFAPCKGDPDVTDSLKKVALEPGDITHVILSHIHWDHIGDYRPFTKARFIVGEPAKKLMENGYPKVDATGFLQDTVPMDRTTWARSDDWGPIGPFPKALDFFGDGSLYLVDAAGHMPGHTNVLARTDPSGKWAYFAADSAHDVRLLTGEKTFGYYNDDNGRRCCMHQDEEAAKQHIKRIASLPDNVTVWIAHDADWQTKWKACQ